MPLSTKSLAGPGYIILNILRAMNIISLLSIIAASIVMLIKTFVVSKFFFFDGVTNVITACSSAFLIISELSLFQGYFIRNWPLLSPDHGFVTLGAAMMMLGVNMLGNLNKESTSQESFGMAFWRLVIASGILVFILGFFNIVASYVFRNRALGITARKVRSHGAIAEHQQQAKTLSVNTSIGSNSVTMKQSSFSPYTPIKSPRKSFHAVRGVFRSARESILPLHNRDSTYPHTGTTGKSVKAKRESVGPRMPLNISSPTNPNPMFDFSKVQKPSLAHHPSQCDTSADDRWPM